MNAQTTTEIKLSSAQLVELAGLVSGTAFKRCATKGDAAERLFKSCAGRWGGGPGRSLYDKLIVATDFKLAKELVNNMVGAQHAPKPRPKVEEKAALPADEKKAISGKVSNSERNGSKREEYRAKRIVLLYEGGKANPRRDGTIGHKSYSVMMKNPGMTVGQFIEKGGRLKDLNWDIAHNYVRLEAGSAKKEG